MVDVIARNNVHVSGRADGRPMMLVHGFGCDQHMWRFVAPAFADEYRIVTLDQVGSGQSDLSAYDRERYASLHGYALDLLEVCAALELRDVVLVGHSVSAMIGVLAAIEEPRRFAALVLVSPSPRYLDDVGYTGGFARTDIDELLDSLDSNYLGWSSAMAPVIMGNPDRPELGEELVHSFCRTDPEIARHFAQVTFLGDNRDDLARVATPALVLQCSSDVLAPQAVGAYVHDRLPDSELVVMDATGHCPNLSAPDETIAAMRAFLGSPTA
ncbi:MAG: alpha/beta hydrolase [Egibacteraceae bacterium]